MKLFFYQVVDAGLIEWTTNPAQNEANFAECAIAALDGPVMLAFSTKGLVAIRALP